MHGLEKRLNKNQFEFTTDKEKLTNNNQLVNLYIKTIYF